MRKCCQLARVHARAFSQEHTSIPTRARSDADDPKFALLAFLTLGAVGVSAQELLEERVVLQTSMGNIELAFFSDVAPITARHISRTSSAATTTPTTSFASTADSSRRLRP